MGLATSGQAPIAPHSPEPFSHLARLPLLPSRPPRRQRLPMTPSAPPQPPAPLGHALPSRGDTRTHAPHPRHHPLPKARPGGGLHVAPSSLTAAATGGGSGSPNRAGSDSSRPNRASLPLPPGHHSPDSTSELVANLRAAGTRGERRGQRGTRTGPTRRSARHAIFAGGGRGAVPRGAPAQRGRPLPAAVRAGVRGRRCL